MEFYEYQVDAHLLQENLAPSATQFHMASFDMWFMV